MSDDLPDTSTEDRLTAALHHQASTTQVSPDAWERIEERAGAVRRRRAGAVWAGVPAAAMVAALLVPVISGGGDGDRQVTAGTPTTAPAADSVRYAPLRLDPSYRLTWVETAEGPRADAGSSRLQAYGRPSADGFTLDARVVVVTLAPHDVALVDEVPPGDVVPTCGRPGQCPAAPTRTVTARGRDVTLVGADDSWRIGWEEPGGPSVAVLARGVTEDEVVAVVEGATLVDGTAQASVLPDRFVPVDEGVWPPESPSAPSERLTSQVWSRDDDPSRPVLLAVHQGRGVSLDTRSWLTLDARLSVIDGSPALYSPSERSLTWVPEPDVLLALSVPDGDEAAHLGVAAGVQRVDEAAWQELVAAVGPPAVSAAPTPAPEDRPSLGRRAVLESGVTDGTRWEVVAVEVPPTQEPAGPAACVEMSTDGGATGTCIDAVEQRALGRPQLLAASGRGVPGLVVAAVGKEVAAGRVERADGSASGLEVRGTSAGFPMNFLVVPLPAGAAVPTVIVALDAAGGELARQTVPVPPPVPESPPAAGPPPRPPAPPGP